jgi:hypothetical protein
VVEAKWRVEKEERKDKKNSRESGENGAVNLCSVSE